MNIFVIVVTVLMIASLFVSVNKIEDPMTFVYSQEQIKKEGKLGLFVGLFMVLWGLVLLL